MSLIYVRTKPGRVAFQSPSGPPIPHENYVGVQHTHYIDRLLNVHKDIERKPKAKKPDTPATKPAEVTKPSAE
jgi:hypothetical protein